MILNVMDPSTKEIYFKKLQRERSRGMFLAFWVYFRPWDLCSCLISSELHALCPCVHALLSDSAFLFSLQGNKLLTSFSRKSQECPSVSPPTPRATHDSHCAKVRKWKASLEVLSVVQKQRVSQVNVIHKIWFLVYLVFKITVWDSASILELPKSSKQSIAVEEIVCKGKLAYMQHLSKATMDIEKSFHGSAMGKIQTISEVWKEICTCWPKIDMMYTSKWDTFTRQCRFGLLSQGIGGISKTATTALMQDIVEPCLLSEM